MAKYLLDVWLYAPRDYERATNFAFTLSTNFLSDLYSNCLPKVQTNGIFRALVEPCEQLPKEKIHKLLPDVIKISQKFDFATYWAADKPSRKRISLDCLQSGILKIAMLKGWDTGSFQKAYDAVLAKNFVNERPWSNSVTSPNKTLKAQVWCYYDSDIADIFVVISKKEKNLNKTLVTSVKPGDVWIIEAIGKLKWISSEIVRLTSKDDKLFWDVEMR